ncbi:MAG: chromate resistance protein ChrB domain-containing protein [Comamonadaceae bacterium]
MDTAKPTLLSSPFNCTPHALAEQLLSNDAPLLIDVRKNELFTACEYTLPGALRRDPLQSDSWACTLPVATSVILYCAHGHELSQNTMMTLRQRGIPAQYLRGGIEQWRAQNLPLDAKPPGASTRWVTREGPKIDRIACPWLVRRFVDTQAQFFYVPPAQVRTLAQTESATPYDVNADIADTCFAHDGALCSFDAFIRIYHLGTDTALAKLAVIVRGADTDRLDLAPQAAGLLAVSLGMSRRLTDDQTMLETMMPVYDALYAWCRDAVAGTDGKHNWKPA